MRLITRKLGFVALLLTVGLTPGVALAHIGAGPASGTLHGFLHPLIGLDHILAMVSVGMLAAQIGGRALWLLPLTFVSLMALTGMLAMAGMALPHVEAGIAISVMALGALVAAGIRLPTFLAVPLVALFAIFHGHAHGTEMPATMSGYAYGLGIISATALLHMIGLSFGLMLQGRMRSLLGGAISLAGLGLFVGLI